MIAHACPSWPVSAREFGLPAWLTWGTQAARAWGLVRIIKMGSVLPVATWPSVLPAWRPLATAGLNS